MKITAKITAGFERAGHLKAVATICMGDSYLVTGVRVVEGEHGLRVYMPSVKDRDDTYHDVCFPITRQCRQQIENAVLNAYDFFLKETEDDEK